MPITPPPLAVPAQKNPELARLFLDNLLSVDQPEFSHEVMDFLLLHVR